MRSMAVLKRRERCWFILALGATPAGRQQQQQQQHKQHKPQHMHTVTMSPPMFQKHDMKQIKNV
jgi:hypothetical protein